MSLAMRPNEVNTEVQYDCTFGNPQFVYAWKLVPTDKTPAGKREDISLREKVKEIQKDLDDGIDLSLIHI